VAHELAKEAVARVHPLALLPEEWQAWLVERGERPFHARQILRWLHRRAVTETVQMTDLALPLRQWLASTGLTDPARLSELHRAADGARKLVLELHDGARAECVLLPMSHDPTETTVESPDVDQEDRVPEGVRERVTLCVSTQHGCGMGCPFCASGRHGLGRSLGAHEILSQVIWARRHLEAGEALSNLVFMGMGEPFSNYAETARALRVLIHPGAADLSPRRITVSTVGLVPGIERLGRDFSGKIGLALSLHAPDDATREKIVPVNRRYPIASLLGALRQYPLPRRRRITIEYTLIEGLNDHPEQAHRLARLLCGLRVKVNLIPLNPVVGSRWQPPSAEGVATFQRILVAEGYSCFVRTRRGDEVAAACGQLGLSARARGTGEDGGQPVGGP
jgi:23S rRNA (adenine2503-C2)-methyltransferase